MIHLNVLRKQGKLGTQNVEEGVIRAEDIQSPNEIPMQESIDKMTIQIALIALAYMLAYLLMHLLGMMLPGMRSVIFGFNFLLGVLTATLIKAIMNFLMRKNVIKKEYTNDFLMTRASNFFYDIMVIAGMASKFAKLGSMSGESLTNPAQAQRLIDQLFACDNPEYTASGRRITTIISIDELDKKF